ncbi:MAG TPA: hypothetical protein VKZ95_06975, partial [Sphingobacteriaceae bacterium]|nr:hypothetical protein [Sphingobacteriaceae bacterium]
VDYHEESIPTLLEELKERFNVSFQKDLELVTIRYYNQETIDRVLIEKQIILEVKDSYTCQMLIEKRKL